MMLAELFLIWILVDAGGHTVAVYPEAVACMEAMTEASACVPVIYEGEKA